MGEKKLGLGFRVHGEVDGKGGDGEGYGYG
jgi:hypothetical protein